MRSCYCIRVDFSINHNQQGWNLDTTCQATQEASKQPWDPCLGAWLGASWLAGASCPAWLGQGGDLLAWDLAGTCLAGIPPCLPCQWIPQATGLGIPDVMSDLPCLSVTHSLNPKGAKEIKIKKSAL